MITTMLSNFFSSAMLDALLEVGATALFLSAFFLMIFVAAKIVRHF